MRTTVLSVLALSGLCWLAPEASAQGRRRLPGPKVGAKAPNFVAKRLGGEGAVDLQAHIKKSGRPVVLIFGSMT